LSRRVNELELSIFPSFEEGTLRPASECHATLNRAQRGAQRKRDSTQHLERSYILLQQAFDLPGRAEFKVTWHSLDRRGYSSSKEGKTVATPNPFTPSAAAIPRTQP